MNQTTHYFKRRQEDGIWHYYKLLDGRDPVAFEMVSFLAEVPGIHFVELDLGELSSKTQYDALWEVGTVIGAEEYQKAYDQATREDFEIFLQGRRVQGS